MLSKVSLGSTNSSTLGPYTPPQLGSPRPRSTNPASLFDPGGRQSLLLLYSAMTKLPLTMPLPSKTGERGRALAIPPPPLGNTIPSHEFLLRHKIHGGRS